MAVLLELKDVKVNYGVVQALKGISFKVGEGEIITLIGPNGAGKSTTMRAIMSLEKCASGTISFKGEDITHKDSLYMIKNKIILAPEGRQVFPKFSVKDNLLMGAFRCKAEEIPESFEIVYNLFPKLKERESQLAGTLSGGEQQMLAVGRAMMAKPDLLLLDEPSLGLAPLIIAEIFKMIRKIHDLGTTILLVEQNARVALKNSDRGYVLEAGSILLSGSAKEMLESDDVREAYFGGLK